MTLLEIAELSRDAETRYRAFKRPGHAMSYYFDHPVGWMKMTEWSGIGTHPWLTIEDITAADWDWFND